jgi:hypothetical protein
MMEFDIMKPPKMPFSGERSSWENDLRIALFTSSMSFLSFLYFVKSTPLRVRSICFFPLLWKGSNEMAKPSLE